jgi:hypothetical protein
MFRYTSVSEKQTTHERDKAMRATHIIITSGEYSGRKIAIEQLTISLDERCAQVWIGRDHVEFHLGVNARWIFA